jgi:translocation and assembly module TamB
MHPMRASAHTATWVVVFSGALAAGIAIHLGHPAARRLVAAGVNTTLEPILLGRVVVDRVGALGLTSLDDVDAHVDGPDGKPVIRVEGVRARISTWSLVRRLLGGHKQIAINVPEASVARVEVALDSDVTGVTRIERAFFSRTPSNPNAPPGPELRLHLRHVRIGHAVVRFEPTRTIDGDVDDLDGSLGIEGAVVTVDVPEAKVAVRGLPGALEARGAVAVHLTAPALHVRVHWDGAVGAVHQTSDVAYDEGHVDGSADFAPAPPSDVKSVWAGCTFSESATLHAEVHGSLPHLDVAANASVGKGKASIAGPIELGPTKHALLEVRAQALDIGALSPSGPASDLSATGHVMLDADASFAIDGRFAVKSEEGTIARVRIPPSTIEGDVRLPPGGSPTANAQIRLEEAGAPTSVGVHLAPKRGALVVAFDADINVPRLDAIARVPTFATGTAHVTTSGTIDLGSRSISGRISADVNMLAIGAFALDQGHVDARVAGPLNAPEADVDSAGSGVTAGPVRVPALRLAGRVALQPTATSPVVAIRAAQVEVGGTTPASVTASLVSVAPDNVRVEDAVVEGFGAPIHAALQFSPGKVEVHAKSTGLDLERAADFAGRHDVRGAAAVNVDAVISAGSAVGQLAVDLTHASAYGVDDANGHVEARLRGRRVWGSATASVGTAGKLEAHATGVQIGPGSLVTARPWRKTFGALDLSAHVDLAKLSAALPPKVRPFDALGGVVDVTARVERDDADDVTPGVDLTVHTEGLELVRGKEGEGGLRLIGIDPTVHVNVDADSGDTALQAEVRDERGTLVTVHGTSSAVPYSELFSDENPVAALRAMTFEADVDVPSRRLDQFPAAVRPSGLAGTLEGTLAWHGSLVKPSFETSLKLSGSDGTVMVSPIDLALGARYDGTTLAATLQGTARNARVLDGTATVVLPAAQVLAGNVDGWKASGRMKLDKMPLRTLGWLRDRQIRGSASGELVVDNLHDDARLRGDLSFANLQLGDIPCKQASVKVAFDGHTLAGVVRIEQAEGFLEAKAHSGARWGSALAPSIDPGQPAQASLAAKQFRAAVLLPFIGGAVTELDGLIDAGVRVDVDVGAKAVRPSGQITYRNGTFELATFGNEFHDAVATIKATPDGVIRLEDAAAHGVSGTLQAAATARFDGLAFAGVRADVHMPAKDPLPLVFDGVQMGAVDGEVDLDATRAGGGWDLDVSVPTAHVELPTGTRSLNVQSLGEVEGVSVGIKRRPGEFISVSLDTAHDEPIDRAAARKAPLKITVKLGRDVHVSRGAGLDVRLEGQPKVTMTDETVVTGQIRLAPGGTIDVQGKQFEIQNGAITFDGADPTNPQVVLTAGWQASDGVTWVYADFVGPLKTGQVKLRSSPPKSQNEILAILLYGSSDDATNSVNSGANYDLAASSPFAAVAGGAATQQLNQALGGLNRALDKMGLVQGISTKVDTSQATPRPEVEVQIARDISLQVAWMIGGQTVTNQDTTLLTLDWHFLRKWFLETTVGDQGTSILNVVWQHRY